MSLETLELRCLSELQRLEANDNLTQDHRETLDSIEEEVVACQKYLDYLGTMLGGAEVNTILGSAEVSTILGSAKVSTILGSTEVSTILGSTEVSTILGSAEVSTILGSTEVSTNTWWY